jgi:hypothetical protein
VDINQTGASAAEDPLLNPFLFINTELDVSATGRNIPPIDYVVTVMTMGMDHSLRLTAPLSAPLIVHTYRKENMKFESACGGELDFTKRPLIRKLYEECYTVWLL